MKKNVYFVSGIDTNIGKSYATAYLARVWREKGINVITQKFINGQSRRLFRRHRASSPSDGVGIPARR